MISAWWHVYHGYKILFNPDDAGYASMQEFCNAGNKFSMENSLEYFSPKLFSFVHTRKSPE